MPGSHPASHFDLLAAQGFYGLASKPEYSGIESRLVDAGPGGHFTLLAACRSEIKGSLLVYSCGKFISCVTGCTRRPTLGD